MNDNSAAVTASSAWTALRSYIEAHERRRELRDTAGLGRGHGRVAALLHIEQTGAVTLADLAEHLDVESSHATTIVNTLEERGYVQRQLDPDDKRRKHVTLTMAGRRVLKRVHAVLDRPPAAFQRLTPDELAVLTAITAKLTGPEAGGHV